MRRRLVAIALVLVASSVAGATQDVYLHKPNVTDTTTRHTYDPAKLKITETTLPDKDSATGQVQVWRILTDYDLILGSVSTKAEADEVLAAAKKFTTMVIIGRRPRTFTYFER
jgi:hypothetical protein